MQQFIINISHEEALLKKLKIDFVTSSQENVSAITDDEKSFVDEALKELESNKDSSMSWKDLKRLLKSKRK